MIFHRACVLLLVLCLCGATAAGCVSYRIRTETPAPEVERLSSTPLGLVITEQTIAGPRVQVRLADAYDRRYRQTTRSTRTAIYQHESAVANEWDEWSIIALAMLPIDVVSWVLTGPYHYIAGGIAAADPEPVVEELNRREVEPLAAGVRFEVQLGDDTDWATLTTRENGWLFARVHPGVAAGFLRAGRSAVTVAIRDPANPARRASLELGVPQLIAMVTHELSGTPAQKRDAWRAIYDGCPASATAVRTAVWRILEPLERELPYKTELAPLVIAEQSLRGRDMSLRFEVYAVHHHRAGAGQRRVRRSKFLAGTAIAVQIDGRADPFELRLDAAGRAGFAFRPGFAARRLAAGKGEAILGFVMAKTSQAPARLRLRLDQIIRMADQEITGDPSDRLLAWNRIAEAIPGGPATQPVRTAVENHLRPLFAAHEVWRQQQRQLAQYDAQLAAEGAPDPRTPAARRACATIQAERGRLLLAQGRPRDAAAAFGEAARHASDNDDLDALERMIKQQLAARKQAK